MGPRIKDPQVTESRVVDPHAALESTLNALAHKTALVDAEGVILALNRSWTSGPGSALAESHLEPGANYLQSLADAPPEHRDDALCLAEAVRRVLAGSTAPLSHTYRAHPSNGSTWCRASVHPAASPGPSALIMHEDVTDRRRTESALKHSQARLRTILTGAPIVLFSVDRGGEFTLVEGMGGAGTGFVSEDQVGQSVFDTYQHMPALLASIRNALEGRVGVVTVPVGYMAFEVRCSPFYGAEGGIEGVVGVATDVTERLRAQRMKDEFVSIVSHELRTPLTSIRGSLGLIEGRVAGSLPEKAHNLVRIARSNTDRLIRLINDILDLDKMEAGHLELHREALQPKPLVENVLREMASYADQASVRVELEGEACPALYGDRDRIVQVLTNLLSNAIKFSPENERVLVRAAPRGRRVRISVTDLGPGIAEENIPRLFQKFHQLDASDTRAKGGSGLGLVISKAIVEAHRGQIGVDSQVGHGSTFYFEIPAVAGTRQPTPAPAKHASSDPAIEIEFDRLPDPHRRPPADHLRDLRLHLETACNAGSLTALTDAHATVQILASVLQAYPPSELTQAVGHLCRDVEAMLQRGLAAAQTEHWDALWVGLEHAEQAAKTTPQHSPSEST